MPPRPISARISKPGGWRLGGAVGMRSPGASVARWAVVNGGVRRPSDSDRCRTAVQCGHEKAPASPEGGETDRPHDGQSRQSMTATPAGGELPYLIFRRGREKE